MASVQKAYMSGSQSDQRQWSIVPVTNIRQLCMLIPDFEHNPMPRDGSWTPENILDKANNFFVNNYLSIYAYRTTFL